MLQIRSGAQCDEVSKMVHSSHRIWCSLSPELQIKTQSTIFASTLKFSSWRNSLSGNRLTCYLTNCRQLNIYQRILLSLPHLPCYMTFFVILLLLKDTLICQKNYYCNILSNVNAQLLSDQITEQRRINDDFYSTKIDL